MSLEINDTSNQSVEGCFIVQKYVFWSTIYIYIYILVVGRYRR